MTTYVLVFKNTNGRISDYYTFSTYERAWNWKKNQIANGNCGNSIEIYDVLPLREYTQAPPEIHEQFD